MRYFIVGMLLLGVLVISVAGFRGSLSRRPPIEVFPDMDRQPKLRPQARANFFADGMSSRTNIAGTIAQSRPLQVGGVPVYPFEESPVNTGRMPGTTNFVETIPLPVTAQLLARGQERYTINCAPCHGAAGDGKGITTKLGMTIIADLHDAKTRKVVQMPDGQLYDTVTNGKTLMQGYGPNITIEDRWAIVAYVRALQRSRLASVDDLPAAVRGSLAK